MSTAIAKIFAAVIIVIALLGGMILLVLYKAPPEAIAAASTAFGIAVAAVVPMVTGKDTGKGPGAAAVLLAAAGAFAGEGCSTPPVELPVVSVETKQKAAGATYGADLLLCVDNNKTEAAIDACADSVRAYWRRNADGGAR